ncbi:MAG: hypothetical protein IT378_00255 [Sandaracinaceae bacterium]|nr:hypothetical protein [Sandaracinaceae bacterium]
MPRLLAATLSLFVLLLSGARAEAQNMNLSLSRLSIRAEDPDVNPATPCRNTIDGGLRRAACGDEAAWSRLLTQFAGAMIPPLMTPAGTRGVRGIYLGFETWITGIDNEQAYWHRGVEGDGMSADTSRSRFVDGVLAWGRFNLRKGLPFGFELGTSIGHQINTTYWTLGLEVRWSLFEGFRDGVGWIPDLAVRGSVQTLVGDGEFNVTIPAVDVILSLPITIASTFEIVPFASGQWSYTFVDSELVDLTPGVAPFTGCNPDPALPTPTSGAPPYCRGDGSDLNNDWVFESIRNMRWRLTFGSQVRYEWFTLIGSFAFDVVPPGEADSAVPRDLPRQWTVSIAAGLTL